MPSDTDTAVSSRALGQLLAKGERSAFHGRPSAAVRALQEAVEIATSDHLRAEATAAGWLLGVAQAAGGFYGTALGVLTPLIEPLYAVQEGADLAPELVLFGALAAATTASVHRQLGRHQVAWEFDALGLAATERGPGLDEAVFDCRLGLASDAVGLGDLEIARREYKAAAALVEGRNDWWRQRVRLDWLGAEIALLAGDYDSARDVARNAVERAELSRAPRHVAKGLVYVGVAQAHAGDAEVTATLWRAATLADQLEVNPLIWRARSLLGALLLEDDPETSSRSLQAARSAVLAIAADLPADLREEWLLRSDVDAVLSL